MSDFIGKKTDYEKFFTSDCGRSSHDFPYEDLHFRGLHGTFLLSDLYYQIQLISSEILCKYGFYSGYWRTNFSGGPF